MKYEELFHFLQNTGKDPARLVFEDELTGIHNRRFLLNYFEHRVSWEALNHPLSLVMVDIDHFKKINDAYGHDVGDQALVSLAGLLKEMAGEVGVPVRYSGDEFLILFPEKGRETALQTAELLLQRIRDAPLNPGEMEGDLRITVSMGIASAPEDAQSGKGLLQKADAALYYAKKNGRDRLADAGKITPQEVFAKSALYRLEEEKMAGRRQQLSQVILSLDDFNRGQNKSLWLMIEGAEGMGKSAFLESFRRSLSSKGQMRQAKISARRMDKFFPYSLMTTLIISLLNQRQDRGVGLFETLSAKEMAYLTRILPQLKKGEETPLAGDEKELREGVFNTLLYFIPKVLDFQPLLLMIDDLQYADEATLLLLRRLMLHPGASVFVCSASIPVEQLKWEADTVPLVKFYDAYHQELHTQNIALSPLTAADIAGHLKEIFPQLLLPENVEEELARITKGNPLFLSEILRKMILDQRIYLSGQQWVMPPLEEGSLPGSLEELVRTKVADLDEESRQLLYQAATFGEDVSMSQLSGSSMRKEARVLEAVDEAVTQGLLHSEFQFNDEAVRFLSRRILDTVYKSIEPDRRRELHDQIGTYQEGLYRQHLLASPVALVYHFERSTNTAKAHTYGSSAEIQDPLLFNSSEAMQYTGERRKRVRELPAPGIPLDPAGLAQIPSVTRCLHTAIRHYGLYPSGSETIASTNRQLKEAIDSVLATNDSLAIFHINQSLMINGQKVDASEFKWVAADLIKSLMRVELRGIVFHRGLTAQELEVLMETLGRIKPKMIGRKYWETFCLTEHLSHIELKQVHYALTVESSGSADPVQSVSGTATVIPVRLSYAMQGEQKLDADDLARIPEILRCFLGASRNIKLYPVENIAVSGPIGQLMESLWSILSRKAVLTLAQVGPSLLVNGIRMDTSEIKTLAEGLKKFLNSIELSSLTFLDRLSIDELKIFFGALSQLPSAGIDRTFWARFGEEHGISGILFDQVLYESRVTASLAGYDPDQVVEEPTEEYWTVQLAAPVAEEFLDGSFKDVSGRVNDLLIREEAGQGDKQILKLIGMLFQGFQNRPSLSREKIVETCRRVLESLPLTYQSRLAKILSEPLLVALSGEKDPNILRQIAFLLYQMSTLLIQFVEYGPASRILLSLHRRHRELVTSKDPHAHRLGGILDRKPDPTSQKLLVSDLKSSEPMRQRDAAQLLGSLGPVTIPLLIDIIKKEDDLRVRQIAASLLGETGQEAAVLLKKEVVLENGAPEVIRVLEVIDTVTNDLKTEMAFALESETPGLRQAAFKLAERLANSQSVEVLLGYVDNGRADLAAEAMGCLGRIKALGAVKALASVAGSTRDTKRLIACCQALGQIGDPACIDPLLRLLKRRRSFFRRRRYSPRVRSTAAYALARISHPRAAEVLAAFTDDRNPRVKEVAQSLANSR